MCWKIWEDNIGVAWSFTEKMYNFLVRYSISKRVDAKSEWRSGEKKSCIWYQILRVESLSEIRTKLAYYEKLCVELKEGLAACTGACVVEIQDQ